LKEETDISAVLRHLIMSISIIIIVYAITLRQTLNVKMFGTHASDLGFFARIAYKMVKCYIHFLDHVVFLPTVCLQTKGSFVEQLVWSQLSSQGTLDETQG